MILDIVTRLVEIVKEAPEVGAIEIRRGLFGVWSSVRVSKAGHNTDHVVVAQVPGHAAMPISRPADASRGAAEAPPAAAASQLLEIKSPMVGTYYSAPEPGAEPYVKVGSRVSPGQVVCIIEAMKIMNDIESELHGVIREV